MKKKIMDVWMDALHKIVEDTQTRQSESSDEKVKTNLQFFINGVYTSMSTLKYIESEEVKKNGKAN